MKKPLYLDWIIKEDGITIEGDIPIKCYKIDYNDDEEIINDWALHIRRNYIDDEELVEDAECNDITAEEYLTRYVIPQKNEPLGPTARSGDITEIIISDLLEFIFGYTVPRFKMKNRSGKNSSKQGTDVVGYKYFNADKTPSDNDTLVATEVKAHLTESGYGSIKDSINDSIKDEHRLARTIDCCRKFFKNSNKELSKEITRFLFKPDNNYKIIYASAGFSSRESVDNNIILTKSDEKLEIRKGQEIFYIHGKKLMDLTHRIYERCKK